MSWLQFFVPSAALTVVLILSPAESVGEETYVWDATPDRSLALVGPRGIVWRFNYSDQLPKPYFDPVSLVSGESLTWNQPPDHTWHHAFWFSWKTINRINYWENDPTTGRPVGRTAWSAPVISTDPTGAARIELELTYSPPDSEPVLRETRVVEVTAPDGDDVYKFDWNATFRALARDVVLDRTPLPPDPGGQPWGGYAGLSLRFAKNFSDRQAVTDRGDVEFDSSGIHRSQGIACDYQGNLNGRTAGIAMLSHPSNPRHPTPWYAIRSEMSYLNPSFLEEEPYTIKAGEALHLRYRVIAHPGRWDAQRLRSEAALYQEQVSARGGANEALIRVLLLSGQNNHDWMKTTPMIRAILQAAGRFKVDVEERPDQLTREKLQLYDVVVSNWNSWGSGDSNIKSWPEATKRAYLAFVRSGGGHVVVHAGSSSFPEWDEYHALTLATWKLGQTFHGPRSGFLVRIDDDDHAVTKGVEDFEFFGELWQRAALQDGVRVLASGCSVEAQQGSGQCEPVAVAKPFGRGRSFTLLLGHATDEMTHPGFRELLARGAEWAATGSVVESMRDDNELSEQPR